MQKVSKPKAPKKKEVIYMNEEEKNTFMETVSFGGDKMSAKEAAYHDKYAVRDYAMISLMLDTGIRVSECVGLDIKDINLKETCMKVIRKGDKEQIIYFSDDMAEILGHYLEYRKNIEALEGHETALFLSAQRKRMGQRSIEKVVEKYKDRSKIMKNISPHKLRSSYATQLYRSKKDAMVLKENLGHESISTSQIYVNISEEQRKEVRNSVWNKED